MKRTSAGLLLFRRGQDGIEVLLVHLGGPFWKKKDAGAWFLPKGELNIGEEALEGAKREFAEEIGFTPDGPFLPLGSVTQRSGKTIYAWAVRGEWNPAELRSNTFTVEWPPRSGKTVEFPEVDRAAFFSMAEAHERIHPAELQFLERLQEMLGERGGNLPAKQK